MLDVPVAVADVPRTCVFCASSRVDGHLHALARALGAAIARSGDELVYGGTTTGLMAEVATGARHAGGRVVGVVPEPIAALARIDDRADEIVEAATMGERKVRMTRDVHRVVTLVGGLGTLDELLEVMTFRQLGLVDSDVDLVVLDPDGFWAPFHAQLRAMVDAGTASPSAIRLRVVTDVGAAIPGS